MSSVAVAKTAVPTTAVARPELVSERSRPKHDEESCVSCVERVGVIQRCAESGDPACACGIESVVRASGQPLEQTVRTDMERRFGTDFSQVRVHTDALAARTARSLRSHAYTVGQNIAFAASRYAPETSAGRRLLAHELVHTIQQRGMVTGSLGPLRVSKPSDAAEHAAESAAGTALSGHRPGIARSFAPTIARQAYQGQEGTAAVTDTLEGGIGGHGLLFEGRMRRTQYRTQAEADRARQGANVPVMDIGWANVRFDAVTCQVTVPVNVAIRGATPADITPHRDLLDNPGQPIPANVNNSLVRRIGTNYISACNSALNGWYEVVLENCGNASCAGRAIPIRVDVSESGGSPDFEVVVSNLAGRSFVSGRGPVAATGAGGVVTSTPGTGQVVLFGGNLPSGTMAHEGGHMALGLPDEYRESSAALRRRDPAQKGDERVRHDWSLAGAHGDYEQFVLLHERHFSFVPAFLQEVMRHTFRQPHCRPRLRAVRRPVVPELQISGILGGSSYGGGAFEAGLGVDMGLELNRTREWQLMLGAHGRVLAGLSPEARNAFLTGARFGIRYRLSPASGGPVLGWFGELGIAGEFGGHGRSAPGRPLAPYAGGGAQLGWSFGFMGGTALQLGVEAAARMRADPEQYRWFSVGLSAGLSF